MIAFILRAGYSGDPHWTIFGLCSLLYDDDDGGNF